MPGAAGVLAAQGGDAGCAVDRPAHTGQLQPLPDDRFAPGLDKSGADEHAQVVEVLVAYPVGVVREVGQGLVAFAGQGANEVQVAAGGQDRLDVAFVELVQAGGEPVVAVAGQQPGSEVSQVVQVLAGVIQVDDLGCGGGQLGCAGSQSSRALPQADPRGGVSPPRAA